MIHVNGRVPNGRAVNLGAVAAPPDPPVDIVRLSPERLDELEPLWASLVEHQYSLTPHLAARARPVSDSWRDRRALERRWLEEEPRSFVLGAELDGALVGYAFVRVISGNTSASLSISDPHAELATLSVGPDMRGRGIGRMLTRAVHAELRRIGVPDVTISVITTNSDAVRFYEREGAVPFVTVFLQRVSGERA
jgi:ribosomal protein S18 acetylase RimI-like enzyme